MEISVELIDRLSHLSMLTFSEDEKQKLKNELEKMMDFINKLEEVNTEGVEPLLHITAGSKLERSDEIGGELPRVAAFSNAPLHNDQFFLVPKVIKK